MLTVYNMLYEQWPLCKGFSNWDGFSKGLDSCCKSPVPLTSNGSILAWGEAIMHITNKNIIAGVIQTL